MKSKITVAALRGAGVKSGVGPRGGRWYLSPKSGQKVYGAYEGLVASKSSAAGKPNWMQLPWEKTEKKAAPVKKSAVPKKEAADKPPKPAPASKKESAKPPAPTVPKAPKPPALPKNLREVLGPPVPPKAVVAPPERPKSASTVVRAKPGTTPIHTVVVIRDSGLASNPGISHAIAMINKVHGDSDFKVPLFAMNRAVASAAARNVGGSSKGQVGGGYSPRDNEIYVPNSQHHSRPSMLATGFSFIHEFGHALDVKGLHASVGSRAGGLGDSLSHQHHEALQEWDRAVAASHAVKLIRDLPWQAPLYRSYALSKHELFARSYSQWIALRSGDKFMLDCVKAARSSPHPSIEYHPQQWKDDDFEPIAKAFDNLFRRVGWSE